MKPQHGFTLLELTTVIAVVGVLASIAIPAHGEYLARAQVDEAVALTAAATTEVSERFASTGIWPKALDSTMTGRYTASVVITAGAGSSEPTLKLTATLKSSGVNYAIAGKTLEFVTADGGVTWKCQGGTLAAQHMPGVCQA